MKSLGELKAVDLRTVWPGEASDFTPWLAQPEHLKQLGAALDCISEPGGDRVGVARVDERRRLRELGERRPRRCNDRCSARQRLAGRPRGGRGARAPTQGEGEQEGDD